mmetsp:Transcript_55885/g.116911  ORF Transcript_55885/g.116911 Transcript_55885/m.116911 type:complete len:413 (+) Transcript_55885:44-1282(+)
MGGGWRGGGPPLTARVQWAGPARGAVACGGSVGGEVDVALLWAGAGAGGVWGCWRHMLPSYGDAGGVDSADERGQHALPRLLQLRSKLHLDLHKDAEHGPQLLRLGPPEPPHLGAEACGEGVGAGAGLVGAPGSLLHVPLRHRALPLPPAEGEYLGLALGLALHGEQRLRRHAPRLERLLHAPNQPEPVVDDGEGAAGLLVRLTRDALGHVVAAASEVEEGLGRARRPLVPAALLVVAHGDERQPELDHRRPQLLPPPHHAVEELVQLEQLRLQVPHVRLYGVELCVGGGEGAGLDRRRRQPGVLEQPAEEGRLLGLRQAHLLVRPLQECLDDFGGHEVRVADDAVEELLQRHAPVLDKVLLEAGADEGRHGRFLRQRGYEVAGEQLHQLSVQPHEVGVTTICNAERRQRLL